MRTLAAALRERPLIPVGLGVLLFSAGPVMIAFAKPSGPVLSFWRLWFGALFLGSVSLVQFRRSGHRPDRAGWTWGLACGVAFGVHQLLFMTAIKWTSVVDVTLMQLLQPFFVGILAALLFGERPGRAFRLWSLVSIGGAALVVLAGASGPRGDPVGELMAVGNVVFFALYFVGSKRARAHIDTAPFLFAAIVAAGVVVTLFDVASRAQLGSVTGTDLLMAGAIALVPGGLGHFVTTWQLHRVPANVPPIMQLAIPFLAGAMAWLVLGQSITWMHLAGGVVTLAGVAGALLSPSGRRLTAGTPDPVVVPGD